MYPGSNSSTIHNPPMGYNTRPSEYDDQIFEEHSRYQVQSSRTNPTNNVNTGPHQSYYDHLYPTTNPMRRTVSEYDHFSSYNLHSQQQQQQQRQLQSSLSYDSYVAEQLYKQQNCIKHLNQAIKSSKEYLAEIEHQMLIKEDELSQLNRIQKNPSEQDIVDIKTEIKNLRYSVQNLFCDEMGGPEPQPTTPTSPTNQRLPSSSAQYSTARTYDNYGNFTGARFQSIPLESPTSRLLRNPIDDSLVSSHQQ